MNAKIAVVLPCYKSKRHVLGVIDRIGPEAFLIIAVDDACPMGTGAFIVANCRDPRVEVIHNDVNLGVGGAVMHGYRIALSRGADIVVKVDSDGQMDPAMLPQLVHPIVEGLADYAKGNRFFNIGDVRSMPGIRVFGNAGLSFMTKLSSGYWNIFDPTNGYTAIHRAALQMLPLGAIDNRFFFESDMLFRLYMSGAVVFDVPIRARYGEEQSNLGIRRIFLPFLYKNMRNLFKRVVYRYFLRDMNVGSVELIVGVFLLLFGMLFGATSWISAGAAGVEASAGTVMLAGLPILAGLQLILGFVSFDVTAVPKVPLHVALGPKPLVETEIWEAPISVIEDDEGAVQQAAGPTAIKPSETFQYYTNTIYWNNFERINAHLNQLATGDSSKNWMTHLAGHPPARKMLSINCGNGWVERKLHALGFVQSVIGGDISQPLLNEARREAAASGLTAEYRVMDANTASLAGLGFDSVLNHAALHHVAYIDRLLREICTHLPEDGLLINYDYVGPHRNQYPRESWSRMIELYDEMPPNLRGTLDYPHMKTMLATDPTEAIHSELIVETLQRYFDVIVERPLGGGIAYQLLWNNKNLHAARETHEGRRWIERIIEADEQYTEGKVQNSLFAFLLCRAKKSVLSDTAQLAEWTRIEDEREHEARLNNGRYYKRSALEIIYD